MPTRAGESADPSGVVSRASKLGPYVLAVVLTAPAVALVALVYWTYQRPLVLGFVPPLVLSAYLGGLRGGLTATAVAVLGTTLIMPMVGSPPVTDGVEALRVSMMALLGIVMAILSERLRTARDRSAEALAGSRRSQEWFQQMFYASPVANSVMRLSDGLVLDVNDAYLATFGLTRDQIVGRTTAAAGIVLDPGAREALYEFVRHERDIRDLEVTIRLPNGETRTGQVSGRAIDQGGEKLLLSTYVDVTERRVLEDRLRETQKLESIGLLAGGVAHDFNNILGVIKANAEMLAESLDCTNPDRELVDDISAGVARASSLTRQLLAFSRKQIVEPVVLDVNQNIQATRKMLMQLVGDDVAVRVAFDRDAPRVLCDPGQLAQVLMNLAVNARDAMKRCGTLWIETRASTRGVEISVRDTGSGMTDEVRARIFEPFFTTKGVGEGTGLGLSVVHGIVEEAGGTIAVTTAVGAGTTFRITLPAAMREASQRIETIVVNTRGDETILLVDDDPHIRAATARALRNRGYTVHEASEGRMALALLEDHEIELMVTDVVMPHMSGRVLADAAKVRVPALSVLFMSGYTDDEILRSGVRQTEVPFLEKPFRLDALAAKIRQLLDTRSLAQ